MSVDVQKMPQELGLAEGLSKFSSDPRLAPGFGLGDNEFDGIYYQLQNALQQSAVNKCAENINQIFVSRLPNFKERNETPLSAQEKAAIDEFVNALYINSNNASIKNKIDSIRSNADIDDDLRYEQYIKVLRGKDFSLWLANILKKGYEKLGMAEQFEQDLSGGFNTMLDGMNRAAEQSVYHGTSGVIGYGLGQIIKALVNLFSSQFAPVINAAFKEQTGFDLNLPKKIYQPKQEQESNGKPVFLPSNK